MVLVNITGVTMATFVRQLLGKAGPGGADLVSLQHWLLQFGAAIMGIRQIVR